ncbi:MAG: aldolase [Dehalococcoidales bacterium]|nr:aldolase [Dehalococcoidales bacterium]
MIRSQFQTVGKNLFSCGLIYSQSGNLSIRMGDNLIITRRGSQLGSLDENDLIETGIYRNNRATPLASTELPVHRAIYRMTSAQAIVHAHPAHTVALSLTEREITPNAELISEITRVPVLGWNMKIFPGALADIIAEALKHQRIVVVHGHGSFAIGQLLDEAYNITMALEESCQVSCLLKSIGVNI